MKPSLGLWKSWNYKTWCYFFFYLSVYLSTNLCTSIYYISLYLSNYLPAYLSTIYLISNPRNDLRMLKLILRAVNTCKERVVGASAWLATYPGLPPCAMPWRISLWTLPVKREIALNTSFSSLFSFFVVVVVSIVCSLLYTYLSFLVSFFLFLLFFLWFPVWTPLTHFPPSFNPFPLPPFLPPNQISLSPYPALPYLPPPVSYHPLPLSSAQPHPWNETPALRFVTTQIGRGGWAESSFGTQTPTQLTGCVRSGLWSDVSVS